MRIGLVFAISSRSADRRTRWTGPILALLVLFGAAPVMSDPAGADSAATSCWSPGGAPALFSWSTTPGIACRDGAEATGPQEAPPTPATAPGWAQATGGAATPAQVTFSGTAYVGVAVAF